MKTIERSVFYTDRCDHILAGPRLGGHRKGRAFMEYRKYGFHHRGTRIENGELLLFMVLIHTKVFVNSMQRANGSKFYWRRSPTWLH